MIVAYGTYTHQLGEVAYTIRYDQVPDAQGVFATQRATWLLEGYLQAATAADLTTALAALETAYATTNQNLIIYLPDGVTQSQHKLLAADWQWIIASLSYPRSTGGEYTTYRHYQVTVQAERGTLSGSSGGQGGGLLEFTETLRFWGGADRRGFLQTLTGPPVEQTLQQQTSFKALQQGSAIGKSGYPTGMVAPIFPGALIDHDQVAIQYDSPQRQGSGSSMDYTAFPISWSFFFESSTPLNGLPRRWK